MAKNWLGIARMTGNELKWLDMTRNFVQTSLAQPGLMFFFVFLELNGLNKI